ncbi:MAG: phosphohistidine phosphatase SixA [Woeseiaceae bacterium]
MKIYLMRHGEALSPQIDPERGLSDNGKKAVKRVAQHLQSSSLNIKHIFHSKKKRARETAEIMSHVLAPTITPRLQNGIAPDDDPQELISEISSWTENSLVASHLPFVPNLITQLTGQDAYCSAITFETGTLVCLEKSDSSWSVAWSTCPSEIS